MWCIQKYELLNDAISPQNYNGHINMTWFKNLLTTINSVSKEELPDKTMFKLFCRSPLSNTAQTVDVITTTEYSKSAFTFWFLLPNNFHTDSTHFITATLYSKWVFHVFFKFVGTFLVISFKDHNLSAHMFTTNWNHRHIYINHKPEMDKNGQF